MPKSASILPFVKRVNGLIRTFARSFLPGKQGERYLLASEICRRLPLNDTLRMKLESALVRKFSAPRSRFARESQQAEKWILIAEYRIPMPDQNSGSAKMFQIMRILLQQGFRLFFASEYDEESNRAVLSDPARLAGYEKCLDELGIGYVFGQGAAIDHLREHGRRYQYAMLFYPDIARTYLPLIRGFCPQARVIFDSGDLHFVRFEREARVKNDPSLLEKADLYRKIEKLVIENSDVTVAISEDEKSIIQSIAPKSNVEVLQNIYIAQDTQSMPPFEARRDLLFIGHYPHSPNADAVQYFVDSIFPLIRNEIPDVEFLIVGSNPTQEITAIRTPGVRVVGYVEDLLPVFNQCRVFVAPLRYGAGVKGKIGQSMSFGLPVVTTSIGAEGMAIENGRTALVEDDPLEFARATVKVYRDAELWNSLSQNALELIHDTMGYDTAVANIERILKSADSS